MPILVLQCTRVVQALVQQSEVRILGVRECGSGESCSSDTITTMQLRGKYHTSRTPSNAFRLAQLLCYYGSIYYAYLSSRTDVFNSGFIKQFP